MTQTTKFITSDHFGAPVIKGDRCGYLVEMLRTVLSTGFNDIPISFVEAVYSDGSLLKVYMNSEHNFQKYQTLRIKYDGYEDNTVIEGMVVVVKDGHIVIKTYNDVYFPYYEEYLNDEVANLSIFVAPVGMREIFTDGNRSVFETDESGFCLYIDDEQPSNWVSGNPIFPIVYMCNGMSDIDTIDGDQYMPNDIDYPERFRTRGYKDGVGAGSGSNSNGIWNWTYRGAPSYNAPHNNVLQVLETTKWTVIGNGNFFYLFLYINDYTSSGFKNYYFGKFKTSIDGWNTDPDEYNCMLGATSVKKGSNMFSLDTSYTNTRANSLTNNTNQLYYTYDCQHIGRRTSGILRSYVTDKPTYPVFYPKQLVGLNIVNNVCLSGSSSMIYPTINRRMILSRSYIYDNGMIRGEMCGAFNLHHQMQFSYNNNVCHEISDESYNSLMLIFFKFDFMDMDSTNLATKSVYYGFDITNNSWDNYNGGES